ncbi:MAG: histidine--tRNA ligase [Nitrospinota bacterium]|nr:histidine--tRNA ligase [Nitrospinota bacterium]
MADKGKIIQRIKGVKDILPASAPMWQWVEDTTRETFESFCFSEIRVPIFEKTGVFSRAIGETSDIVEKEMYTFTDRGGESLTLRPEGTASVVRAYVENGMFNPPGARKLYYMGPMFRAERPQAGRYRQFHQIGAELFGPDDPAADAEVIHLLMSIFRNLHLEGLTLHINSLGCPVCRPGFRDKLGEYLATKKEALCENCQRRVDRNPLRVLDCKSRTCGEIAAGAPTVTENLCADCHAHFERTILLLEKTGIVVTRAPRLVRGLDYYSRTAFEVTSQALGAQDAVAGGGRYNTLVEQFGGPPTPAIGFAIGMERLISLLEDEAGALAPEIFFLPLLPEAEEIVFKFAGQLREEGFLVDMAFGGGGLKSQLKKADRASAHLAVIIGENELAQSQFQIKDMKSGEQFAVPMENLGQWLDEYLLGPD